MFGTLRQMDSAHELFSSDTTSHPFPGKRQGKLAQTACVACRASKMKCSAEPDGCRRCASRNLPCNYPKPPRLRFKKARIPIQDRVHPPPNATLDQASQANIADQNTMSDKQGDRSMQYSDLGIITPESHTDVNNKTLSIRSDDLLPAVAPHSNIPIDLSAHSNSDVDLMMASWIDASPERSMFPFDFSAGGTTYPVAHAESTGGTSTSSRPPSSPAGTMHHVECLKQLVQALDTAEISLVWDLYEQSEVKNDILKIQAQSVTDCAALAECPTCTSESTYVTAILSLARKILNSLIVVCSTVTDGPCAHDEMSHQWHETGHGGDGSEAFPRHARGWRPYSPEVGHSSYNQSTISDEGDIGVGGKRHESGKNSSLVMFGQWHLDAEDELKILQTLLTSRLERLAKVIGGLEGQISLRDWPNHQAMCARLRKSLSSCAFKIRTISQDR